MGFRRDTAPRGPMRGAALTRAMVGIGMNFSGDGDNTANIEDVLLAASVEGLEHDDLRTLSVLTSWLCEHLAYVNADRLVQLVANQSERVRAYWAAVARWPAAGHRFARMKKWRGKGSRVDLLRVGTEFQLTRAGEHPLFKDSPLRVPANALRNRPQDVLTQSQLARQHAAYRARVMMGPSYRADMWAALERDPAATVSAVAREAYGSIATASAVRKNWLVLREGLGTSSG